MKKSFFYALSLLFSLFTFLLLSPSEALACRCVPPGHPLEEFEKADGVFAGQVINIESIIDHYGDTTKSTKITFWVEEAWKGVTFQTLAITTGPTGGMCGYEFKKGEQYIVYANGDNEQTLSTSICTRTNKLIFAHEDLKELGEGNKEFQPNANLSMSVIEVPQRELREQTYAIIGISVFALIAIILMVRAIVKQKRNIIKYWRGLVAYVLIATVTGVGVFVTTETSFKKTKREAVEYAQSELVEQIAELKIENRALKKQIKETKAAIEEANYCTTAADCIASRTSNTIRPILDARIVGSYASPGESSKIALNRARPQFLYLTDITEGLLEFDVSDPAKPKFFAQTKIDGGGAYAVAVDPSSGSGSHDILVSGYGNPKIALILGTIGAPYKLIIQDTIEASDSVQDLWYDPTGHYGIAVTGGEEFELIRITHDPDAPFDAGFVFAPALTTQRIQTTAFASAIDIAHNPLTKKLFLAQGSEGVGVFDLRNLDNPTPLGTLDLEWNTYAVAVDELLDDQSKNFVYVLNGQSLITIEVSDDGKRLQQRGTVTLAGEGADIDVYANTAAVAEWENGVELFDVKDPDNPRSLGVVDTSGRARDVVVMRKYDIPPNPCPSPASCAAPKISPETWYIYVADDRDDLQVIEWKR